MEGFIFGNRLDLLLFEGKAIVYVGLLFVVLGADVGKMLRSRPFERLLGVAAIVALILTSLDAVGVEADLAIPILPLSSFGLVGADAASVFGALGLITLALGVTRASNRLPMLGMAAAFLAPALVAQQRAALLGLAVSILVIAAIALTARHRLRLTLAEGTLVVIATAFVVGTVTLVGSGIQGTSLTLPFASSIDQAFGREDKAVSAQSRVSQWRAAPDVFRERPLAGSGLGTTYQFYDPGPKEFVRSNLTHNIGLDLLIRTGAIGLALFGLALLTSLWAGIRAWRGVLDPVLAAIGLACAAIIAGLVAKGMVESLFEKYRLVALMGLLVGVGLAALSRDLVQRSTKTGGEDGVLT
jgi:O-antigen ligase